MPLNGGCNVSSVQGSGMPVLPSSCYNSEETHDGENAAASSACVEKSVPSSAAAASALSQPPMYFDLSPVDGSGASRWKLPPFNLSRDTLPLPPAEAAAAAAAAATTTTFCASPDDGNDTGSLWPEASPKRLPVPLFELPAATPPAATPHTATAALTEVAEAEIARLQRLLTVQQSQLQSLRELALRKEAQAATALNSLVAAEKRLSSAVAAAAAAEASADTLRKQLDALQQQQIQLANQSALVSPSEAARSHEMEARLRQLDTQLLDYQRALAGREFDVERKDHAVQTLKGELSMKEETIFALQYGFAARELEEERLWRQRLEGGVLLSAEQKRRDAESRTALAVAEVQQLRHAADVLKARLTTTATQRAAEADRAAAARLVPVITSCQKWRACSRRFNDLRNLALRLQRLRKSEEKLQQQIRQAEAEIERKQEMLLQLQRVLGAREVEAEDLRQQILDLEARLHANDKSVQLELLRRGCDELRVQLQQQTEKAQALQEDSLLLEKDVCGVQREAAAVNDPMLVPMVEEELEEVVQRYNRRLGGPLLRRIRGNFYLYGIKRVELRLVNSKLMRKAEDGWACLEELPAAEEIEAIDSLSLQA
ncbi:brct domain related protein [Cyclospora cayetanensis]|uniref:Brct domain related protein n=1 Tax=Cyclospora cayetanensis TaxID=88456 RepID=A0A1D3DA20_9EIME|nr:brct domain related protein [Cyclospora cayetanensis]